MGHDIHQYQASMIVAGFGLLTAVTLAFFDFHRPHGLSEIRHATLRERYWLAISGYASVGLTAYVVLVAAVAGLIINFLEHTDLDERGRPYAIGSAVAVFILSWVGRLPVTSAICAGVRTTLQTLVARYPQSSLTARALIARAPFEPGPGARAELRSDLLRFALPEEMVDAALAVDNHYLSVPVIRVLLEISTLRERFATIRGEGRYAGFFKARSRTCDSIEQDHYRLLRRVARALFVLADLRVPDDSTEELALELSEFLCDECDAVRARYQKLLAELMLSALPTQEARRELLKSFGYTAELATIVPFWPVVAIFAVYLLFPVVIMIFTHGAGDANKISPYAAGLIAFAQSWAVSIALFLAVFPKEADFGRPTLFSLPWRSYLLYGTISYVIGAAIQFVSYKVGSIFYLLRLPENYPAQTDPFGTSLFVATICVYFTVGQSILIDRRLQSGSLEYRKGRLSDALWFTGPMAALVTVLQVVFYLIPIINDQTPPFSVPELVVMTLVYLLIVFMMGFFVPSTSHAHLEATKLILSGQTRVKPMAWSTGENEASRSPSIAGG